MARPSSEPARRPAGHGAGLRPQRRFAIPPGRRSPRARPFDRWLGAAGRALATAACALLLPLSAAHAQDVARTTGEYGLHVRLVGDSVVVYWATADSVPGRLEVFRDGHSLRQLRTPAGRAHRAAFAPGRSREVTLEYGADAGSAHRTALVLSPPVRPPVEFSGVDSLYIFGDTHGDFDGVSAALRAAGLIGDSLEWTGGKRHLVFDGDLMDRGPHVTRLLWLVYRLEHEAARAGGRVHILLGNHETMVMLGDLRYVHPAETALAALHGVRYDALFHAQESLLGRWLASKPAVIRIDRALIVHGGMSSDLAQHSLRELDRILAHFMKTELLYRPSGSGSYGVETRELQARDDFFWHPRSLLWYRGYMQSDSTGAELAGVLRRTRTDFMVVGHTAADSIRARFDGKLIAAHTPRYGAELLLLVRERGEYRRFRLSATAPPQAF